ncbi:MAG: hypothetical protein HND55_09335 [Pseudomonadota bacterium]|nr:MAG: hypothetical protein HND55_09335 [Pseudomonadota bacterium]
MKKLLLSVLLLAVAATANAGDFEISRYVIAGGGTMESSGGPWTLAGTIGQWEATEPRELSGGQWKLTGGFWAELLEALPDFLFQDRFEE